jgi:hypothetical protein
VRINPKIKDLLSLDDVAQLKALQAATCNALEKPESRAQIKKVAHMLVASSFYYERTNVPRNVHNGYSCTGTFYDYHITPQLLLTCAGKICCRFEDDSDELRAFGDYLRNQQRKDSRLAFEIENVTEQRVIATVSHLTRSLPILLTRNDLDGAVYRCDLGYEGCCFFLLADTRDPLAGQERPNQNLIDIARATVIPRAIRDQRVPTCNHD